MTVARMTVLADAAHGGAFTFNFLAVALPQSGMVLDRAQDQEDDLLSTGIDGQRWLRMFSQYPVTDATTIIDMADYPTAITYARLHNQSKGRFADMQISYGSLTVTHRKMKIRAVSAAPRIGTVSGSGVTGAPTASVITHWQWQCTEPGA